VATVFELSEPYLNHLVGVLPPGVGVCATCWTAIDAPFARCFRCRTTRATYGAKLADLVVPIALAVKREQLAHELWHYKYSPDPNVRGRLELRLAAVLWRFLGEHEQCVARACRVPQFDIVTTVPGTKQRSGDHPLARIVGTTVGQTKERYEQLLVLGDLGRASSHEVRPDRYRAVRPLTDRPAVLLIDDTWTTGGNAQSASIALRAAGASTVAIIAIGRHFDRAFGSCEDYYKRARARRFRWETCCLEPPARTA
jgi:predicted amidophosphoribosyltransferase